MEMRRCSDVWEWEQLDSFYLAAFWFSNKPHNFNNRKETLHSDCLSDTGKAREKLTKAFQTKSLEEKEDLKALAKLVFGANIYCTSFDCPFLPIQHISFLWSVAHWNVLLWMKHANRAVFILITKHFHFLGKFIVVVAPLRKWKAAPFHFHVLSCNADPAREQTREGNGKLSRTFSSREIFGKYFSDFQLTRWKVLVFFGRAFQLAVILI